MTHADIFCKLLSETTGKPESFFRSILAALPAANRGRLDDLADDAPALLEQLRSEKAGILRWLVEGAGMAHREGWHKNGPPSFERFKVG